MQTILLFKRDLEHYPTYKLEKLRKYLGIPNVDNRNDLLWLLAIHQAQRKVGTMHGSDKMYSILVQIPVKMTVNDGSEEYDRHEILSIYFYHPDKAAAKSIFNYIQLDGPDDKVHELLTPILKITEKQLQDMGEDFNVYADNEEDEIETVVGNLEYTGRDPEEIDPDDFGPEPKETTAITEQTVEVIADMHWTGIEIFDVKVPYDERYTYLYNAVTPTLVKSAYKR